HKFSTGDLMARATNDLNAVRMLVGPGIMYSCNTVVLLIGSISMMLWLSPGLTLFALIPLPLMVILVYKLMGRIHDIFKKAQEQFSIITTQAQENIAGIRVVKAYVQEEREKEQFDKLNKAYIALNLQLVKIRGILWSSMAFLSGLGVLIILWMGGAKVASGELTLGVLVAFFTLLGRMTLPMIAMGWVINLTQQGIASMGRINEIYNTAPEIFTHNDANETVQAIRGDIDFRQVSFRYNGKYVLQDINLRIPAGKSLAIVGPVGSGKSTLMHLIPRLMDATDGELRIDGTAVQDIPLKLLRQNIGFVPQETFLFSDTIKGNILFGVDSASERETQEAAMTSQVYDEILSFPKQFDTLLGERGINLSGGQKQRTAISRAVIRKPSILLLDDALSSVDTYTEEEILKRLRQIMKGRTSIIVSHRISTIRDADEIIVFDEGKIVEKGTHESLVAREGVYADLFKKQQLEQELEAL
ncbi:MAG: ABC transporter ATP-binding protein, partial [bacterium]